MLIVPPEKQRMAKDNKLKTRGFRATPEKSGAGSRWIHHKCKQLFHSPSYAERVKSPKFPNHTKLYLIVAVRHIPSCSSKKAADHSHYSVTSRPSAQDMNGDPASGLQHANWCFQRALHA